MSKSINIGQPLFNNIEGHPFVLGPQGPYSTKEEAIQALVTFYEGIDEIPNGQECIINGVKFIWRDNDLYESLAVKTINENQTDLNFYTTTGVYRFNGIRYNNFANLPINNNNPNASITGELVVYSSVEGTTTYRSIIGQTLFLSNAEGNETKIYTRSANKTSKDGGATYEIIWGDWQVMQGMKEVGLVSSYDSFIDNGMYSGIYNNNGMLETFVIITINDYIAKSQFNQPKSISQLKYALNAVTNKSELSIRVGGGENFTWDKWKPVFDEKNITAQINSIQNQLNALNENTENSINNLTNEINELEKSKQPTLVSGENIKTINDEPILGKGNIKIEAGITEEEKKELNDKIDEKAPKIGYAPDLKVNFANELTGRGDATAELIGNIRPTGIKSIGDGNATITKIKGNSVVWNQLQSEKQVTGTIFTNQTYFSAIRVLINPGVYYINCRIDTNVTIKSGSFLIWDGSTSTVVSDITATKNVLCGIVRVPIKGQGIFNIYHDTVSENQPFVASVTLHNLTLMFGADNEPDTIENFEERKPFGVTNDYNEGIIVSFQGGDIKSIGFNAWDEIWEIGAVSTNGTNWNETTSIRTNYIKVVPNQTYEITYPRQVTVLQGIMYDKDKKTIVGSAFFGNQGKSAFITTLPECHYIRVSWINYITSTIKEYQHDICIHLTHSGYRDGEYAPYEANIHLLPNINSILDFNGNQLFPYGLLSAGNVHDEITDTKAIKRIGIVDMGNLTWRINNEFGGYDATLETWRANDNERTLLTSKYSYKHWGYNGSDDKVICSIYYHSIFVRDSSYTSVNEFKQAMKGVLLYYELATPIEIDLPEPLNMTYEAWDFGTEELIANGATTPLNVNIVYEFNAVDRIRENSSAIKNKADNTKVEELEQKLDEKQPLLIGDEFKTINGESIMGKGNIVISGGEGGATTIVNDLFSGGENKALSAEMGKELNGKMNYIIPLNVFSKKGAYSINSLTYLYCLKNTEGGSYVTNSPVKSGVIRITNNNTAQAQICFLKTNNFSTTYNHNIKQYLCDGETSAHGIEPGSVLEYETKEPTYIYMVYGANGERIPTFDVVNIPDIDDIIELHEQDQELRDDFENSVQQQSVINDNLESKTDSIIQVVSSISFEDFTPGDGLDKHGTDENGTYKEVTTKANYYYDYTCSLNSPIHIANSLFKEKRRFSVFVKCKLSTEEGDESYNIHAEVSCPIHIVQDGIFFTKTPISFETVQIVYVGDFECVGGKEYASPIKFAFSTFKRNDVSVTTDTMVTCRYYGLYIVPTEDILFASREQIANRLDYSNNKTNFIENSVYAITSETTKQAENADKAKYSEHSEVAHILDTPYRGKVVKVIGDSLVTFISWKNFQKLLGVESVMTGQGGGKVCNNDPIVRHGFCTLERLAMLPKAMKLLVVYGGANDGVKTADTPYKIDPNKLGNINDKPLSIADMCNYRVKDSNVSQTNTLGRAQTFYQGYKTLLRNIQALYPDCQIICVTQHKYYNYVLPNGTFSDKLVPTIGSAEKVAAIKEIAAEYSVPVCDLWETSGVNDYNILHTLIDSEGVAVHQTTKTAAIEEALILNKVLDIAPKFDIGKYNITRSDDVVTEMRQWVVDVRSDEECNVMTLTEAIQAFTEKVEAENITIKKNMILTFYSSQSYSSKVYFLENETNPSATSSWQEWTIQNIDDPNQ